jgi:hypothetical protein
VQLECVPLDGRITLRVALEKRQCAPDGPGKESQA